MGNNFTFDAHCNGMEFDRNVQKPMLNQVKLDRWAIFHGRNAKKEADTLSQEFQKVMQGFNYPSQPPKVIQIEGNDRNYSAWEAEFKKVLNPQVTCVVVILQGQKNSAPLYNDVKTLLFKTMPVPSQVVLQNTISRGKNVRSIVTKILIQMNTKIGGEPWAISDMPFTNMPTMIIGYDVHHKLKAKSHLAYCATTNRNFTKYWSVFMQQAEYQEIADKLQQIVTDSLNAFKNTNGIFPKQLIFFRDGVGDGQKIAIMKNEMVQIKQALAAIPETKDVKILFLMVNKRVKTKLVQESNGRVQNPQPGTILDNSITADGAYDFYLISQATRQGVPTPTHYTVLLDEIKAPAQDVYDLTYKLCYTFYNYSGSVKIPSPVKYADKLAGTMGDRKIDAPHKAWESLGKGLYFI